MCARRQVVEVGDDPNRTGRVRRTPAVRVTDHSSDPVLVSPLVSFI